MLTIYEPNGPKHQKVTTGERILKPVLQNRQLRLSLRVRLVERVEKWEERKNFIFSHFCLVWLGVEKWRDGKKNEFE